MLTLAATCFAALFQLFSPTYSIFTFYAAAVAAGWLYGKGPTLLTVGFSVAAVDYLFIPPVHSLQVQQDQLPYFLLFSLSILFSGWIGTVVREKEQQMRFLHKSLEVQVGKRTADLCNAVAALNGEMVEKERIELALRQSEDQFRQMAENIHDVFWLLDPIAGEVRFVSRAFERICERSVESLYANPASCLELFHPADVAKLLAALHDLEQMGHFRDEFRIVCSSGTEKWLEVKGSTAKDVKGKVIALVGTAQEITERKEAERFLRESEDRYRDLVEHSEDLICTHDLQGRLLTVNDPPIRILGYCREHLLNKSIRDFLLPELSDQFDQYLARIQKDGVAKGQMSVVTKSGERRIWEYHNTLRTEGVARPIVRGVAHDITEKKLAERAHRRSEEKFSKAFLSSPIANAISTLREGRFIDVNESFEKLTGLKRAEVIGRTSSELGMWIDPRQRAAIVRELENGGSVRSQEIEFRSHERPPLVVLYSAETIDVDGERCLLAVGEDITGRKRAEERLRASEAQYRSLFHEAPYGIFRASRGGRLLMVNPAMVEMLGYDSESELLAKNIESDVYVDGHERRCLIERAQDAEHIEGVELHWKRKDGVQILVRANVHAVRTCSNEDEYFETMVEDVTQQRALEDHMRQVQKMEAIALLAGGIAHDFNNLLTGILGYAELIVKSFDREDSRKGRLQMVVDAALKGRALTSQLLAFSHHQTRPLHPVEMDEEIEQTKDMLRRLIGENIEIRFILESSPMLVLGESGLIYQVVLNLAVNGRDSMPQGGKLTIRTSRAAMKSHDAALAGVPIGEYVVLEVCDTGCGMDRAVQERIFEPFFTTKEPGKGTGLGLCTVYGIIQECSGHIRVHSEIGCGSRFEIYFPVANVSPMQKPLMSLKSRSGRGESILVVEDDPRVREMLRDQLRTFGYSVFRAENASQALQVARRQGRQIDLLLTDIVMPGLSGTDLARQMRKKLPFLKVLYMTGYAAKDLLSPDSLGHDSELLPKPFTSMELNSKLQQLLGRSTREGVVET